MNVTITPRKTTDRGGYYCMPLLANVPVGRVCWELVRCPECGTKFWKMPHMEFLEKQGAKGLCTMCALKKGVAKS